MNSPGRAWEALLSRAAGAFTSPSFALFVELLSAWACATGRRTITGMVAVMGPTSRRAHDAYHRLVRAGRWDLGALWATMVCLLAEHLGPEGKVVILVDDTLWHRGGRKVEGAGSYRDAVRSSHRRAVYARGLCLVVLAIRLYLPWGGMPVAVPVGVALHRKGGPKLPELARGLVAELAGRLPGRHFVLCCDGAYAGLAGKALPRTTVVSRMRRDAAIYGPPPARTGRRGRPRERGERLPAPQALGRRARKWETVEVPWRGRAITRKIWSRPVLWYKVSPKAMVLLVVVRDPEGKEPDDYFFTTGLDMAPGEVLSLYGDRWAIECTYRDVKQLAHGQEPQTWKGQGPERAANLAFWLHGAVWLWYLVTSGTSPAFSTQPWYTSKRLPSFADALAQLRKALWRERISGTSQSGQQGREITTLLVEALAMAA